jgi:hypothetical protein
MKALRVVLPVVLLSVSIVGFAQSDTASHMNMSNVNPESQSETQKSFNNLKALAGEWEGVVTADPPSPEIPAGTKAHVTMRVTSRGNALVHEMQEPGTPLDATKYDHPVTMIYMDGDRINLVHYCDAGNRPHMAARKSADGKTVEFDFVDLSGGNEYGHMYHTVFTTADVNHHSEDWTYMMPGDKPMHAHMELQRVK